jgi:hypothetical protein
MAIEAFRIDRFKRSLIDQGFRSPENLGARLKEIEDDRIRLLSDAICAKGFVWSWAERLSEGLSNGHFCGCKVSETAHTDIPKYLNRPV